MRRKEENERGKIVIITKNAQETKRAAALLAGEVLKEKLDLPHALAIGLFGELGSGKTTFAQGFAKGLGVKKNVLSPTFVLMRQYSLQKKIFKKFIHIDCYRLEDSKELDVLGWNDLIADPKNIILIEWAGRIEHEIAKNDEGVVFLFFCRAPCDEPRQTREERGLRKKKNTTPSHVFRGSKFKNP